MAPLVDMVMSIARLSAGSGYQYLMRHTARGDAPERAGDAMTRYYTNPGYPHGIWLGQGLPGLADGAGLTAGSVVTEQQMARLFGAAHDPVTDAVLGREYVTTPPPAERIAAAVAALPPGLAGDARDARIAAITAAEKAKPRRSAVAGFDLTFSVPQSLYAAAVAHSDTYDLLLADNLTHALGLAWETRLRGRDRNPRRELAAVPDHLIAEFSQRSYATTAAKDDAIASFVAAHHRQPTGPEAVRIRQAWRGHLSG